MQMGIIQQLAGLGAVLLLVYWTAERLLGQGEDPAISKTMTSETGQSSLLISGVHLVGLTALVAAWGFRDIIAENSMFAVALFVLVGAHWYFEKEERE